MSEEDGGGEGNSVGGAFAGVGEALDGKEESPEDDPSTTQDEEPQLKGDIPEPTPDTRRQDNGQSAGSTKTEARSASSRDRSQQSDVVKKDDVPHRVRHDSPTAERDSLNIYVSTEDKQRLNDLKNLAEQEFDDKIKMIDVYLAALRSDFYNDESFLNEMRNIGYDYFDD